MKGCKIKYNLIQFHLQFLNGMKTYSKILNLHNPASNALHPHRLQALELSSLILIMPVLCLFRLTKSLREGIFFFSEWIKFMNRLAQQVVCNV